MKTRIGFLRTAAYLLALTASIALVACGGGGGGTTTSSLDRGPGVASVGVSVASAPDFPAGTTFAAPVASAAPAAPPVAPAFDHVYATITKLALIPSSGPEFPSADGEEEMQNSGAENGNGGMNGFVTIVLPSPVVIDLLHPPTARQVAKLLNKFSDVPAGEYSKIRVYYSSVVGVTGDVSTPFHPTVHYHFDVHFVGGDLVVPVATNPEGGIRFYEIAIQIVGLKIQQAGKSGNILLRPQIFATVAAPKYLVHGTAANVDHDAGTFDILTPGAGTVHAAYVSGTDWVYVDEWTVPSSLTAGAIALRDGAFVDAIGLFQGGVLQAEEVDITFPDFKAGTVDGGWTAGNVFVLRNAAPDNTVFPQPDRFTAYYDNVDSPHVALTQAAVDNNVFVTARGYAVAGGIDAFWITIGVPSP